MHTVRHTTCSHAVPIHVRHRSQPPSGHALPICPRLLPTPLWLLQLIEDTHTSIDVFRHGWTSRYVNEPGEHLSLCTHQPNSIAWRIKQVRVLGAANVQLLSRTKANFHVCSHG